MQAAHKMAVARGKKPAQKVIRNARIINVFTREIEEGDIAIEDGIIMGIGSYEGREETDLEGSYVAPGFIDGHVHIESSMVSPGQFANVILPKGTTTIIADPHEIANVCGGEGIRYMIESSDASPLDVFMMIPSSVPATPHETAGATITPADVDMLSREKNVLGLGEVMNYPGVIEAEEDIHEKLRIMKGKVIDGHAPSLLGADLEAYIAAGVMTDHECSTVEEMLARIRRGMYVHLREGSATRNVKPLLEGVDEQNARRLLFCTDDKHPEDIRLEGQINYNINLAIDAGMSPLLAIQMATLNAAECYRLEGYGGIAPGYAADLVVFDSLERIEPRLVFKKGEKVAEDGAPLKRAADVENSAVLDTVNIDPGAVDLDLKLSTPHVKVIGLVDKNITTRALERDVRVENGRYVNDPGDDILKLAVVERHRGTNGAGVGLVEGFGIKNGAIAMTIAHDSHNLVIVGDTDRDMRLAMETITDIGGGIVLVKDGRVDETLPLEVGGIMSKRSASDVASTLESMKKTIRGMGLNERIDDPFISLAFLSLPVIPDLKLTDKGLFDVRTFELVPIEND